MDEIDINDFISEDELLSAGLALAEESDLLIQPSFGYIGKRQSTGLKKSESKKDLQYRIADYYLNKQLEKALMLNGDIPSAPEIKTIGIGFVDIVDYSYIASWLSPKENQLFLNGLYTAFHSVLKRQGGYLNKISGDSMMFHFGGNIDPAVKKMDKKKAETYIAEELLYTCADIQKTCRLFNSADEDFLKTCEDKASKNAIKMAFMIISNLRENLAMVSGINAMFQVRVRIGACLGEVCIGNFGPEDARQWDIIGEPVIEARRMESTAPIDGLRISAGLYEILNNNGITEKYYQEFADQAAQNNGFYQRIRRDELFKAKRVILYDKKNVEFDSFAVQTNPSLPEFVKNQIGALLDKTEDRAETIIEIIKYYRGNRHVIAAIEALFKEYQINIHKSDLLVKLFPKKYAELLKNAGGDKSALNEQVNKKISLFAMFSNLANYQDTLNEEFSTQIAYVDFTSYEEYVRKTELELQMNYQNMQKIREKFNYVNEVLFPIFLTCLRAGILEYQKKNAN